MSAQNLSQFAGQKYVNVETYRKTGAGVVTPVGSRKRRGAFTSTRWLMRGRSNEYATILA